MGSAGVKAAHKHIDEIDSRSQLYFNFLALIIHESVDECVTDLDKLNLVKFGFGGFILGFSLFSLLPKLPQKTLIASKVVKSDSKISNALC